MLGMEENITLHFVRLFVSMLIILPINSVGKHDQCFTN